jgi:hypothetical protein
MIVAPNALGGWGGGGRPKMIIMIPKFKNFGTKLKIKLYK